MTRTIIRLGERDFVVGLTLRKFPNGGSWSLFICPRCGGRSSILRLLNDQPTCKRCCTGLGIRRMADPMGVRRRVAHRLPKLLAKINTTARLHPRPGRTLDKRPQLENALRIHMLSLRETNTRRAIAALVDAIADAPLPEKNNPGDNT
jgi:hypothetical protein